MILFKTGKRNPSPELFELVQGLGEFVSDFIDTHPGTTLNDVLEALIVIAAAHLAGVPEAHREGVYGSVGRMLWEQTELQRDSGQHPMVDVIDGNLN
jgi:hypothetical protein